MTTSRRLNPAWLFTILTCFLVCCDRSNQDSEKTEDSNTSASFPVEVTPKTKKEPPASPIVTAARSQVGQTVIYDPAYVGLAYPGGDVPIEKGVCTDVVIRALRDAVNMDLQKLVHEDMKASFHEYPVIWGLKKPDRNIDHRRVPNLKTYFERQGYSVPVTKKKEDYIPGDLVTCTVNRNLPHIMIVSDKKGQDGAPLVIHNIGKGTKEENRLFEFPITGHYRIWKKPQKVNTE